MPLCPELRNLMLAKAPCTYAVYTLALKGFLYVGTLRPGVDFLGVSENRGPEYSRILIVRTAK